MEEQAQVALSKRMPRGYYSDVERGSGIYMITNSANGKQYVGSGRCLRDRFAAHRRQLRAGTHHSQKLQRAWDKHGEASFVFKPIISCAPHDLLMYKQAAIDLYQPHKLGYNILATAGSRAGHPMSEATKAKISAANKGQKRSEEVRAKIRARMAGYSPSEETRKKIGDFNRGKQPHPNSILALKNRVYTEEQRKKVSEQMKRVWAERNSKGDVHE